MTTLVRERLACQKCGRKGEWAPASDIGGTPYLVARSTGWRVWDGETLGGQPLSVRLCPVCAGTATDEQRVEMLSYKAECSTCGVDMAGESDEPSGYVFTAADAEEWRRDHRCEPDTYITKPTGVS